nr:ferredoxin--NADP reductase [Planctomycetales bacterium]
MNIDSSENKTSSAARKQPGPATSTTAVGNIEALRSKHYNATAVAIERIHDELLIVQVRPDDFQLKFTPGQYTVLGLGYWEPRLAETQDEQLDEADRRRLIKRAYSISCPLLDEEDHLVQATERYEQEFYITLVRFNDAQPPALTPRLFALSPGDRLFMSPHPHGHYSLDRVQPDDDVVLVSTGTGEAPHNAMLAQLLSRGHTGRIVNVN